MKEIFDILVNNLKVSAPVLILIAVLAYFLKLFLEKSMDAGFRKHERKLEDAAREAEKRAEAIAKQAERHAEEMATRIENIGKTSLEVKRELRGEEREELVALRVAVDKWEYFLQTGIIEYAMTDPAKADVRTLIEKDTTLVSDVRLAIVRTSMYLRNKDLENNLMSAVVSMRKAYYPLINAVMLPLIDLQTKLLLIDNKVQAGIKGTGPAPTEKDREDRLKLEEMMTDEAGKFAQAFVSEYQSSIARQMVDLKDEINLYVYRPIKETDIDKE